MKGLRLRDGWVVLSTVGTGGLEGLSEVVAARTEDGIGVVVCWQRDRGGEWDITSWGCTGDNTGQDTESDAPLPEAPPWELSGSTDVSPVLLQHDDSTMSWLCPYCAQPLHQYGGYYRITVTLECHTCKRAWRLLRVDQHLMSWRWWMYSDQPPSLTRVDLILEDD